jgi:AraC family transcriptional activator of pobA
MDAAGGVLHISSMLVPAAATIPTFGLYGERAHLPDVCHVETIATRSALHGWDIKPHRHDRLHQFVLVTAGEALLTLDGRRALLAPPAVVNLPPRTVHGFRFAPDTDGFVLTAPDELVATLLEALPVLAEARVVAADGLPVIFAEAAREHADASPARPSNLAALVTLIAGRTAAAMTASADAVPAVSPLVRRFEALLEAHFREHWRVRDYAAAVGVTAPHLSRACRAATGLSASRLVAARLAREARRLLAYTPHPVSRVAEDLGFVDPAYFTRFFTREAGTTPTAFRARTAAPRSHAAGGDRDPVIAGRGEAG